MSDVGSSEMLNAKLQQRFNGQTTQLSEIAVPFYTAAFKIKGDIIFYHDNSLAQSYFTPSIYRLALCFVLWDYQTRTVS